MPTLLARLTAIAFQIIERLLAMIPAVHANLVDVGAGVGGDGQVLTQLIPLNAVFEAIGLAVSVKAGVCPLASQLGQCVIPHLQSRNTICH